MLYKIKSQVILHAAAVVWAIIASLVFCRVYRRGPQFSRVAGAGSVATGTWDEPSFWPTLSTSTFVTLGSAIAGAQ